MGIASGTDQKKTQNADQVQCTVDVEVNFIYQTPCSRIILDKLPVPQLVRKFPALHDI